MSDPVVQLFHAIYTDNVQLYRDCNIPCTPASIELIFKYDAVNIFATTDACSNGLSLAVRHGSGKIAENILADKNRQPDDVSEVAIGYLRSLHNNNNSVIIFDRWIHALHHTQHAELCDVLNEHTVNASEPIIQSYDPLTEAILLPSYTRLKKLLRNQQTLTVAHCKAAYDRGATIWPIVRSYLVCNGLLTRDVIIGAFRINDHMLALELLVEEDNALWSVLTALDKQSVTVFLKIYGAFLHSVGHLRKVVRKCVFADDKELFREIAPYICDHPGDRGWCCLVADKEFVNILDASKKTQQPQQRYMPSNIISSNGPIFSVMNQDSTRCNATPFALSGSSFGEPVRNERAGQTQQTFFKFQSAPSSFQPASFTSPVGFTFGSNQPTAFKSQTDFMP